MGGGKAKQNMKVPGAGRALRARRAGASNG
jgi:hypothetical protein